MRRAWLFVFAACFAMAGIAEAQDKPVNFSIGGGYTAPNAEVRDHLGDGYNFNIGLQFNVTPVVGIEGLYSFNGLGEKRISVPVSPTPGGGTVPTDFFANMNMQFFDVNLVLQKPEGSVRPYGLVGMGVYYRPIEVTTPGVGYVPPFCDPWWYVCYPGGFVPVDRIVGERSSTDFGMDFGGGVRFGVVFAELRYHYIWGPEVEVPSGSTPPTQRKANGQFLQTTFGFRF
jgi:outer membrane protein with beta-barrel domain